MQYRLDYLECRAFGHTWEHYEGLVDHDSYYTVKGKMSECSECGMIRYRWYMRTGKRWGPNTYEAPEGYSLSLKDHPNAEKLPSLEEWRGVALKRDGFPDTRNVTTIKKRKIA
jgi:hypothetical protein